MPHPVRPLGVLLLLAATAACASTPRVDVASEEQTIRELDRRWVAAVASKNLDSVMSFYAHDARFAVAHSPLASGAVEIRSGWQELLSMPELNLTFAPDRIEVASSGDMAYDVGTYRLSFRGPQGRVEDSGQYTVVWRKVGSQWKVASDAVVSTAPLPQPAPATAAMPMEGGQAAVHQAAELRWSPLNTPGFPSGAQMAVIHGNPAGKEDYTIRIRFPDGYDIPPHWHPGAEHLTVVQGTFLLGMGERMDRASLKAYTAGDFVYAPARMPHYGSTRGETIVQLHGMGPFETKLVGQTS